VSSHYVAFEGIEGTGKTTLAARCAAHLRQRGVDVRAVREPGGTDTGERIRGVLLDHGWRVAPWSEALLFAAARAQLAHEVVGPALAAGTWVVSDRSVYSSLAYQGGGRDLGIEAVRAINAPGLGAVWPELVVLLRLAPADGLERQQNPDRIGSESLGFQERVAAAFEELAAGEPDRFVVADASRPVEAVWDEVRRAMEERWEISSPV
jgi:dTMP kinase